MAENGRAVALHMLVESGCRMSQRWDNFLLIALASGQPWFVQKSAGLSKIQKLTGLFCERMLVTAAVIRNRTTGAYHAHRPRADLLGRGHTRSQGLYTLQCDGGHSGGSNQHPALIERQDCTLVAWYPSLYAPRAGGAYDSHHRTAGIAGRTRRRGRVAARGARAAVGGRFRLTPVEIALD